MSDTSDDVLLDDFEDIGKWDVTGLGARQTHITTFAEGAPAKDLGVYADGVRGADYRALALLVRDAVEGLEIELLAKTGQIFALGGRVAALNLYVRSPHASIWVYAQLGSTGQESRQVLLGQVTAGGEWQRIGEVLDEPIVDAELLGLRIRLVEVVKPAGEVMILLDDLTVRSSA